MFGAGTSGVCGLTAVPRRDQIPGPMAADREKTASQVRWFLDGPPPDRHAEPVRPVPAPSPERLKELLAAGAQLAAETHERLSPMFVVTEADLATYHD